MSVPEQDDLVTALGAVDGVADAEIVHAAGLAATGSGAGDAELVDAGTLRLTLMPGADEVSVATEVNRVLREEFGLGLDASRVQVLDESAPVLPPRLGETRGRRLSSVPAIVEPPTPVGVVEPVVEPVVGEPERLRAPQLTTEVPVYARGGRLLIRRMQVVSTGVGISTAVTLSLDGAAYVGEVDEPDGPLAAYTSVAGATLRAVEEFVGGRARLCLDRVELVMLGADQVALVGVSMTSVFGTERLVGSSVVREDVRRAVVRATLDSLNRRVEAVLST